MNKLLLILLSIILCSLGLSFIIINLNLLAINYSILEYIIYILTHLSCNIFFIGIIILFIIKKSKSSF